MAARRAQRIVKPGRRLAENRATFGVGPSSGELYQRDFYSWARSQAARLRRLASAGRPGIDYANLAEEIDSLGKEQANALRSSFQVLLCHLLKWQHQPSLRSKDWRNTIRRERRNIELRLEDNPGLKSKRSALFARAYRLARADADDESDLPVGNFPAECSWTLKQAVADDFWPE